MSEYLIRPDQSAELFDLPAFDALALLPHLPLPFGPGLALDARDLVVMGVLTADEAERYAAGRLHGRVVMPLRWVRHALGAGRSVQRVLALAGLRPVLPALVPELADDVELYRADDVAALASEIDAAGGLSAWRAQREPPAVARRREYKRQWTARRRAAPTDHADP